MSKPFLVILVPTFFALAGCSKNGDVSSNRGNIVNGVNLDSTYFTANVDGSTWYLTGTDEAYFMTNFDGQRNALLIAGVNNNLASANGPGPMIFLSFDFIPKPGRYYFNNLGDVQADSGTIATYSPGGTSQPKWSTGGYIDIDSVSEWVVTGAFNFTAVGDINDSSTTHVTLGEFEAIYVGGSGQPL